MGKKIDGMIFPIESIDSEYDSIIIECNVFGMETIETKNGLKITTLKLTDYTDSIYAKVFSRTEDEFKNISKIKLGSWIKVRGYIKNDEYSHELVLMPRDIEETKHEEVKREDNEPIKRVELHAHTMMSQMDGVIDETALVKQAISWGMPGIGIMDHDGCQAFPHVFEAVTKYNKNKKKEFSSKITDRKSTIEEIKASGNEEGIK